MSIIQINQIKSQLLKVFSPPIDLSDIANSSPQAQEDFLLTRSLSAYTIHLLTGATPSESVSAITDVGIDNGIDAIYFFAPVRRLYLVQAKWLKNGIGEPDFRDIKKLAAGARDLFNLRFDRFNAKIIKKSKLIETALNDPLTRYEIVIAYTGPNKLAPASARELEVLKTEFNDAGELLFTTVLNQVELHRSLAAAVAGEPINLEVGLKAMSPIG